MPKKLRFGLIAIMLASFTIIACNDAPEKSQPVVNEAEELNEKGMQLYQQGKPQEALTYFEQALAIDQKKLGENHPDVAIRLNNIGSVMANLVRYQEAIKYYEQALAIDKATHGEDHPDVASDLHNIGEAWRNLGEYKKAKDYLEAALPTLQAHFGEEHPYTKATKSSLAHVNNKLGITSE